MIMTPAMSKAAALRGRRDEGRGVSARGTCTVYRQDDFMEPRGGEDDNARAQKLVRSYLQGSMHGSAAWLGRRGPSPMRGDRRIIPPGLASTAC